MTAILLALIQHREAWFGSIEASDAIRASEGFNSGYQRVILGENSSLDASKELV